MKLIDKADIEIITLKDWLSTHLSLLKKDKMAAFMQCRCVKAENKIIICNEEDIPEGYTVNDIVEIIEGKHIHL